MKTMILAMLNSLIVCSLLVWLGVYLDVQVQY